MIKTNIKMRVTPEQSAKVQEICFMNGITWQGGGCDISLTNKPFLFIRTNNRLSFCSNESEFKSNENIEIDPELFIRTNGSCIEKEEFTYPMWFKDRLNGHIVEFTEDRVGTVVYSPTGSLYKIGYYSENWASHINDEDYYWQQVENPDLAPDKGNNKAKNPNSKHYELWENFEAIDVIKLALTDEEYKGFLKGNILKYRLRAGKKNIENDNIIKDINKSIDYERELNK